MLLLVITGLIESHFSDATLMLRTAATTEGGGRGGEGGEGGRGREGWSGGGRQEDGHLIGNLDVES